MKVTLAGAAAALALVACADVAELGNLGVAGASCLSSPECAAPLQCLGNVCVAVDGDTSDTVGSDAVQGVDTRPEAPDIVTDYDAAHWDTLADAGPAAGTGGDSSLLSDCGALGVASAWDGTFVGDIDYILNAPPEFNIPPYGVLPVNGDLGFEISCVESKFIVRGDLIGVATVADQGDFPFTLKLQGQYDPVNRRLVARMVEGKVSIYGAIEVFFEGNFTGQIGGGSQFLGVWDAASTGTNQEIVTGQGAGDGTWHATAQ